MFGRIVLGWEGSDPCEWVVSRAADLSHMQRSMSWSVHAWAVVRQHTLLRRFWEGFGGGGVWATCRKGSCSEF